MPSLAIPKKTQVLVIGGGPAGSYAAAALAREGIDVVLLEMSRFPRYHIGESLLPSVRHYLRFISAEDLVASHGFAVKPGSAIKFNQYMREGYTDFVALGASNAAWNVVRAEFDHLLLQHAARAGVRVFEQTRVTELGFHPPDNKAAPHASGSGFGHSGGGLSASVPPSPRCPPLHHRVSASSCSLRSVDEAVEEGRAEEDMGAEVGLGRPRTAVYETDRGGRGEIEFEYLVDASGRAGIMSTRYLKNRTFNESLKNVAVWGYWRGAGTYGQGTSRENAPYFEALSDESGWAWFIPLHNGLTSVGVVMAQKQLGLRSRASSAASSPASSPISATFPVGAGGPPGTRRRSMSTLSTRTASTLAERYLGFLELAPGVAALVGEGELVDVAEDAEGVQMGIGGEGAPGPGQTVKSASDYSYHADCYAGEGWRLVGDAGAFIDPFFSSGVHLAMTGGLSAAASICASIRGDCTEAEAAGWHSSRVAISYTRFLVVVLSAYKQIRAQSENVLCDISEGNFDKAFAFLRPVIQGGAEMGARLSEDELQHALDFCVHLFNPTTPEQHEHVRRTLASFSSFAAAHGLGLSVDNGRNADASAEALMDVRAPIVDPGKLNKLLTLHRWRRASADGAPAPPTLAPLRCGNLKPRAESQGVVLEDADAEVRMVLEKVNARRVIHSEHGNGLNSLEEEAVGGFVVRLERGSLGLKRAMPVPA